MPLNDAAEREQLVGLLPEATINVVLGWRQDSVTYRVERLQMHGSLPESFREIVQTAAEDAQANRLPRGYDPEWPLQPNEMFHLEADPLPGGNLFPELLDFPNLQPYGRRTRKSSPSVYVILAQTEEGLYLFGRRLTGSNVLRTSGGVRAMWDGDTFSELDGTIVSFPDDIDWIVKDNEMLILDEKAFHALFRDVPQMQAAVRAHIATITARLQIGNLDVLIDRCQKSVPMMSRLQRVIERRLYEKPVAELRAYATEYGIPLTWEGDTVVYNGSLEEQWNLFKVLDEARFTGALSGDKYEAAAKAAV